jgi:hypothetical protein
MIKIIKWLLIALVWSPFETIHIIITQRISSIGVHISSKLNNKI